MKKFLFMYFMTNFGADARRCDLSCYFQRYCGTVYKQLYAKAPEECRAICDADASCMVGTWHPPKQIWDDEDRPVCFLFSNDGNAAVRNWGGAELYEYHPGAKMIRCTITQNVEVERYYPDEFHRRCGTPLQIIYGDLSETCRQRCNDMENCFVAQWHPSEQVWADEPRTTCWLWAEGTEVCNWGGAETIDYHPGAQMFSCRPASYS